MGMNSKPRIGKVFYLPLEYQIFLQPYNMSTAALPYAFHQLKKTSHLANLNYQYLTNTSSTVLSRSFCRNSLALRRMGEEVTFLESINRTSTILGKRKNKTLALNQAQNDVQFVQSITRTCSIDKQSGLNCKHSVPVKSCDDVEVVFVQNIGESSSCFVKENEKIIWTRKKPNTSNDKLENIHLNTFNAVHTETNMRPQNNIDTDNKLANTCIQSLEDKSKKRNRESLEDFRVTTTWDDDTVICNVSNRQFDLELENPMGLVQYPLEHLGRTRINRTEPVTLGNAMGAMPGQTIGSNQASSSQCSDLKPHFTHNIMFGSSSDSDRSESTIGGGSINTEDHILKTDSHTNEVKIMSYNILAQTLLLRHRNLYGHLERKNSEWEARLKNIVNEILEYNCDIVCLQEVEETHLECLTDKLSNYKYVYKKRTGPTVDGCCILYKPSKYTLVKQKFVEYFKSDFDRCMNKHNIAIIVCLKSAHDHITIANTHLLYNPRRNDIRYEQCKYLLNQIGHFSDTLPRGNTPVIITGDFNSEPNAGLYNYILRHRYFKLSSAYDPSNYSVSTYHESWCLVDYIFYTSDSLRLLDLKVLPRNGERISRIPNAVEGSDHFSLVAKFALP